MKRRFVFLVFPFLLFVSCRADAGVSQDIAKFYSERRNAAFDVCVVASFPEREAEFSLAFTRQSDGSFKAGVLAPEDISGITATVSQDGVSLSFDGAYLETGLVLSDGLSPIGAVPRLYETWLDGTAEPETASIFGTEAYLLCDERGDVEYRTWFSSDTYEPLYAEIFSGGVRVIKCTYERSELN